MYKLTNSGKRAIQSYISELKAKRKEILDAGKDTADYTELPTEYDIVDDIEFIGLDGGEYYNSWGVTDNYDADYPLSLQLGKDFVEASTSIKCASVSSVPYQLVSMAAIIRDFDEPEYKSEGHRLLTDIADTLYNVGIGPDDMKKMYKVLYYQYGKEYWDKVLEDMSAIDSQLTSQAKEEELLADYNDRIGITASTKVTASTEITPENIYERAIDILPSEDIDHHASDLYLRKTPESTALVEKMKYKDSGLLTTFTDAIDGDTWYDLPFCYTPWHMKNWVRGNK